MTKYEPARAFGAAQHARGLRSHTPKFFAFVVSSLGELGEDAIRVIEILTGAYRRKVEREGERDDGETPQGLTSDFRNRFHTAIQMAVLKGNARMTAASGMPFSQ